VDLADLNGSLKMNAMLNNGLKMLACGAAAAAITLILSLSFIQSTEVVHNDTSVPTHWTAKLTLIQPHAWLGQPEQPAVLVD
jgi:hypothetical protein